MREFIANIFTNAFPSDENITWRRFPDPDPEPSPVLSPPPVPAHGFENVSHQQQDDESVDQEQSLFSAETTMKSPEVAQPESDAPDPVPTNPFEVDDPMDTTGQESLPTAESDWAAASGDGSPVVSGESLFLATIEEIRTQMKVQIRELLDEIALLKNEIKEVHSKQDSATASLTTLGIGVSELKSHNSQDNVSGMTGTSLITDELKAEINNTVNAAILAAYSEGGIVQERCREDTDGSVTQFTELIKDTIVAVVVPDIQKYYCAIATR